MKEVTNGGGIFIISKITIEKEDQEKFKQLPEDKKDKIARTLVKINQEFNEYIIGIDVAAPDSKDYSAIVKTRLDEDGNRVLESFEYL